ncbi:hypothetical protein BN2127_JRS1_04101 [Bacillus cereus]|nr:hypothetical protein BN2127_JRS1_04101 [Bacillus cereus]
MEAWEGDALLIFEEYKQGIIRSYNLAFLMGAIIFFIAFIFNIGRVLIEKKRIGSFE